MMELPYGSGLDCLFYGTIRWNERREAIPTYQTEKVMVGNILYSVAGIFFLIVPGIGQQKAIHL
jgi:hypothetical protein